MLGAGPFERVFRTAARESNRLLFDKDKDNVAFDVSDGLKIVRFALQSINPKLADDLPKSIDLALLKLKQRDFATRLAGVRRPASAGSGSSPRSSPAGAPRRRCCSSATGGVGHPASGARGRRGRRRDRDRLPDPARPDPRGGDRQRGGHRRGRPRRRRRDPRRLRRPPVHLGSGPRARRAGDRGRRGGARPGSDDRPGDAGAARDHAPARRARSGGSRAGLAAIVAGFIFALDWEFAFSVVGLLFGAWLIYFGAGELLLLIGPGRRPRREEQATVRRRTLPAHDRRRGRRARRRRRGRDRAHRGPGPARQGGGQPLRRLQRLAGAVLAPAQRGGLRRHPQLVLRRRRSGLVHRQPAPRHRPAAPGRHPPVPDRSALGDRGRRRPGANRLQGRGPRPQQGRQGAAAGDPRGRRAARRPGRDPRLGRRARRTSSSATRSASSGRRRWSTRSTTSASSSTRTRARS